MNLLLLIFFAIPVATIILSIVLQTLINSPIKVSAIFFSIFLVVAFAIGDDFLLIAVIIYTIISFVSAYLTKIILYKCENKSCYFPYTLNRESAFRRRMNDNDSYQNYYSKDNFDYIAQDYNDRANYNFSTESYPERINSYSTSQGRSGLGGNIRNNQKNN